MGLTGYVIHKQRILELAREFRRRGKFVVAGGPFASLCPEELRGEVDVVFVDEAEYTWPRFLADFAAGRWQAEYQQDEKPSMHDSPLPRFDLLKIDRYRTMTIQFARGCPYNCEFCDIIVMYGRKPADEDGCAGDGRGRRDPPARAPQHLRRRRQLHRQQEGGQAPAAGDRRMAAAAKASRSSS